MAASYSSLNCAEFGETTRTPASDPAQPSTKAHSRNRSSSKRETSSTSGQWPYESSTTTKPRSSSTHSYHPPALSSLDAFNYDDNYSFSARLVGDDFTPLSSLAAWPIEQGRCSLLTPTPSSNTCSTPHTPKTIVEEPEKQDLPWTKSASKDSGDWVGFTTGPSNAASKEDWIAF